MQRFSDCSTARTRARVCVCVWCLQVQNSHVLQAALVAKIRAPQGKKREWQPVQGAKFDYLSYSEGDTSSMITGTGDYHNAPVCQVYQRPNLGLAGLRQANEGQASHRLGTNNEGNHPQWSSATIYHMAE